MYVVALNVCCTQIRHQWVSQEAFCRRSDFSYSPFSQLRGFAAYVNAGMGDTPCESLYSHFPIEFVCTLLYFPVSIIYCPHTHTHTLSTLPTLFPKALCLCIIDLLAFLTGSSGNTTMEWVNLAWKSTRECEKTGKKETWGKWRGWTGRDACEWLRGGYLPFSRPQLKALMHSSNHGNWNNGIYQSGWILQTRWYVYFLWRATESITSIQLCPDPRSMIRKWHYFVCMLIKHFNSVLRQWLFSVPWSKAMRSGSNGFVDGAEFVICLPNWLLFMPFRIKLYDSGNWLIFKWLCTFPIELKRGHAYTHTLDGREKKTNLSSLFRKFWLCRQLRNTKIVCARLHNIFFSKWATESAFWIIMPQVAWAGAVLPIHSHANWEVISLTQLVLYDALFDVNYKRRNTMLEERSSQSFYRPDGKQRHPDFLQGLTLHRSPALLIPVISYT